MFTFELNSEGRVTTEPLLIEGELVDLQDRFKMQLNSEQCIILDHLIDLNDRLHCVEDNGRGLTKEGWGSFIDEFHELEELVEGEYHIEITEEAYARLKEKLSYEWTINPTQTMEGLLSKTILAIPMPE